MFKPLGSLLPDALGRMKVRKPIEAALVCRAGTEVLANQWDHAVPMRAISYRHGTLTVAVTSAAWAHEVMMRSEQIKEQTNQRLGSGIIAGVKTRVSPSQATGPSEN